MKTILFVPCNRLGTVRFALCAKHLPGGVRVIGISNKRFIRIGAEEAMQEAGIKYERIQSLSINEVRRLISKHKPGLIVTGNDADTIVNMFVVEGKAQGIPSLVIQDGAVAEVVHIAEKKVSDLSYLFRIYSAEFMLLRFLFKLKRKISGEKAGHQLDVNEMGIYATDISAWGDYSRRIFEKRGISNKAIHITGCPNFDLLPKVEQKAQGSKKVLLYATSDMPGARLWSWEETAQAAENLAAAVSQIGGVELIIRPHPSESLKPYEALPKKYPCVKLQLPGTSATNIYGAIQSADAVLTEVSTVAFESILLGKPVGIINFTGREASKNYPAAYVDSGAAIKIASKQSCKDQLEALLGSVALAKKLEEGRKYFIADQVYRLDGKSSKRVADLMVNLCKDR
ncbi:MAG: CDP-glycerol glycerophosphotransferase family protein [Candidatus Micrarchaeota archaeon]|nr:CDP-glycerol glycerophosphotransferase family protein [Candidatus Micrarchaeota archaeon]